MKVQVVNRPEEAISGYRSILFNNLGPQFDTLSNNECEFILANNLFDSVPTKAIPQYIQLLMTKLRIGGTMVIGGKDLQMFCKFVKNGLITEEEASSVIESCASLSNYIAVRDMIGSMGLKVDSVQLNGIHYEITATRQAPNGM